MATHIISVGISSYSNVKNLQYAAGDAEFFMDSLSSNLVGEVTYRRVLTDSEAQLTKIRLALETAKQQAKEDDTLIFYFSGHGTYQEDDTFLAPHDIDLSSIKITGLSSRELQEWIDESKYKTKIVLLDCCYSGGINAKSIDKPTPKNPKSLKTIDEMDFRNKGVFIFTACKSDEPAYELSSIQHGVFTYCLIDELSKMGEQGRNVAASSIIGPVNEAVRTMTSKEGTVQITTSKLLQEGVICIPTVRKEQKRSPEFLTAPRMRDDDVVAMVPNLSIGEKAMKKHVEQALSLTKAAEDSRMALLAYRSHLLSVVGNIHTTYQEQQKNIYDIRKMEGIIADIEASCLQLVVLIVSAVLVGGDAVFDIIARQIPMILSWEIGQSGTNRAIKTPEVVVLLLEYAAMICSIYTVNFDCVGRLLGGMVRTSQLDRPEKLVDYEELHFADSLGGNAKIVFDHVLGFYDQQKWLHELLGMDKTSLRSLVLQANLCLCVAKTDSTGPIYSAYNNYDIIKVMPLVDEIHYNQQTRKALLPILHKKTDGQQVAEAFAEAVTKMNSLGSDHWWGHVLLREEDFISDPGARIVT